jgi:hypothetical protein
MNLERFIGDEATFPLEHRILNTVLLIAILITLFTAITNFLLGLEFMAVVSCVCCGLLITSYYLSVVREHTARPSRRAYAWRSPFCRYCG